MEKRPDKKAKAKRTLKWNMIGMMVLVWLIPVLLASSVMFFYASGKLEKEMEQNVTLSEENAVELCVLHFEDAVRASRNASYLNVIRKGYYKYLNSSDNTEQKQVQLYNTVTNFLNDQYRYNPLFETTLLYLKHDPNEIYYTYSNMKRGTFNRVKIFREAYGQIEKCAQNLDTGITFLNVNGCVYMVRNIMTSRFQPFAVLVMELNQDAMFKSLESISGYNGYEIYVDGRSIADTGTAEEKGLYNLYQKEKDKNKKIYYRGIKSYAHDAILFEGHKIEFFIALDSKAMLNEKKVITYMMMLFVISMIPLILLIIWFFHNEVNRPVRRLMEASEEIEKGNLGYELPEIGNSQELAYLGEAFNRMSAELKHQFDTIYSEELALRDAKIKALQSQINPHFLNNTLEIINWEARMNGNFKVSGMIEALSTMLEATLNRRKGSFISLAEEVSYMDAYLYIVSRRFEDKLEVHKDIDESLFSIKVPRLIIQPIVENAVEHGNDEQNRIIIYITLKKTEEDTLIIEIKNHGILREEDKRKVETLLKGDTEQGEKSLNLGIRNVNQRLKIIYGGRRGLTIKSTDDGYTVSTMTLLSQIPEEAL